MICRQFCIGDDTEVLHQAAIYLESRGCRICREPDPSAPHMLLPVPTGRPCAAAIPPEIAAQAVLWGGNLTGLFPEACRTVDLLRDPRYLAQNAALTAECALRLAAPHLPVSAAGLPVLVLGWGRIGKCLTKLLDRLGARVTAAARKPADLAMAEALGYEAVPISWAGEAAEKCRLLINTVPFPILTREQTGNCPPGCVKIDLASVSGIEGSDVICARGLPGKYMPEASGRLIGETVLRICDASEGGVV